ncbi:MAG: response regulator [Candidatus Electrothrix sp. YB6]
MSRQKKRKEKGIILIVDDQAVNLEILFSFLQEQDFGIRVAQNGVQALDILQKVVPDLILLDVVMPEMDGLETCRRIRQDNRLADIPVIFMTALDTVEDKVAGFEAGGVDYITKPFQQIEVLARINTHITLRKKALRLRETREELLQQKNMLEALINSIPDPIYFKDVDNTYIGCNRAFETLSGRREEEIVGKTDAAVFSSEIAGSFRYGDQDVLVSGMSARIEELFVTPDDGELFFDIRKTPYICPDGKLMGVIGICRNITALKRAKQQAEEERERLGVMLQSIADGVISTDVQGKIIFINRAAEQLTGWNNAEAVGRPADELLRIFDEESGEKIPSPVAMILQSGRRFDGTGNTVLLHSDGRKLNIADSGAPIRDRENRVIGAVIIFRDITWEKEMEKEQAKIRKLESVGVLAGGIAHDFNNLLSAILGNIELAAAELTSSASSGDEGGNPVLSLLSDAQKATERATGLTCQLLTFSKGGEPVREKMSLPELIRESAQFVLHGSPVSCAYSFAEDLWMIHADSGQISQVIQNIILNAKDAMPDGGRITVQCSNVEDLGSGLLLKQYGGNYVLITIEDTGSGIPRDILDSIFDPYFTTKAKGNGLGLAICHSIVKKHDGHITVHSEPGQGTVFSIYLPALSPADETDTELPVSEEAVLSTRVLVMDDDPMIRTLAQAQLSALGHEPLLAQDGAEAISMYRKMEEKETPVDLVILDLTVPGGMGGKEAARKILQLNPKARLIVASGYSNDPVMAEYREYGFRAAVAKPFTLRELNRAIASAL